MRPGPNPAQTYDEYFGPAMFTPLARAVLDAGQPAPGERVLDVACGTGIVTHELAPRVGAAGRLVGLDLNPGMLAVARAKPAPPGAAIEWMEGNGTAMELPAGAFDLVVCQQGLQFFPDRAAGAREFRRVLADGGRAVIACWLGHEHQAVFQALVEAEARHLGVPLAQPAMPFSLGDPDELRRLLADAGFSRVEVNPHTIDARFASPDRFLTLTVTAAASVMAMFADLDIEPLVGAIGRELAPVLERHRDGDYVRFPMPTNIAVARA